MRLALFKASIGTLASTEEIYPVSGLHVGFAKKKQTALLSGLLVGDGLRRMMEGRTCCAADTVYPFAAASTDRGPSSVASCNLTLMS